MILLRSIALSWLTAHPVAIEIDVQPGIPSCMIVWLGDTALHESRERIRSALKNSGYALPAQRVTINLAPAHLRKSGSQYDLALAIGILLCKRLDLHTRAREVFCIGELALSGEIRAVIGAIPLALAAIKGWEKSILIGPDDYLSLIILDPTFAEYLICIRNLNEALAYLEFQQKPLPPIHSPTNQNEIKNTPAFTYNSIIGHAGPKRALEIAAAGRHNILLEGPPGSGKSMLAIALGELLPPLSKEECIDVAQIYSLRGIAATQQVFYKRPFRQVHKSASMVSIIGGTNASLPGEMSLAHQWILFFDELLEFDRACIESLREPLERRQVTINRAHSTVTYPASFLFIGATNPCPCGYLWDPHTLCQDSDLDIKKYRSKLSGPIADRIDLRVHVGRVDRANTRLGDTDEINPAIHRVEQAYQAAIARSGKVNSNLSPEETERLNLPAWVKTLLQTATQRFHLSLRAYHRIIRVARTIADLEASKEISPEHMLEAISYREV